MTEKIQSFATQVWKKIDLSCKIIHLFISLKSNDAQWNICPRIRFPKKYLKLNLIFKKWLNFDNFLDILPTKLIF